MTQKFKRRDRVNYLGTTITNYPDGVPTPKIIRQLNGTYIWAVINIGGVTKYAIQHPDGISKVDFLIMHNTTKEAVLEDQKIQFEYLDDTVLYIFALEYELDFFEPEKNFVLTEISGHDNFVDVLIQHTARFQDDARLKTVLVPLLEPFLLRDGITHRLTNIHFLLKEYDYIVAQLMIAK